MVIDSAVKELNVAVVPLGLVTVEITDLVPLPYTPGVPPLNFTKCNAL